jgi:hypothetical protein
LVCEFITPKKESLGLAKNRIYYYYFERVHFLDVGMRGHLEPKVIELRTKNSLILKLKKKKPKLVLIKKLKQKISPILKKKYQN